MKEMIIKFFKINVIIISVFFEEKKFLYVMFESKFYKIIILK